MGKRELLLVVCFVIVGVVVYQATAPPPGPGERGLSFGRLIEAARREIRGNRATAELTTTATHKLTLELTELRITGSIAEVEVTGEDRQDVESTAFVHSTGYDEAEAQKYTRESKLIADQTASALILRMQYPTGGRQRGTLKLKVPPRLHIRVEPGTGSLAVTNVAAVELAGTRGDATVRQVAGRVEITHRGGDLTVENAGSLEFNGRAGSLKVNGVRGDTSIRMEQGGELTASGLTGRLDVESRNADLTFENLEPTRGPIRINAMGGEITMKGLKADARIDGRNAELRIAMAAPAQVAIYSEGETVALTPPPGGFILDALVIEGRVTPDNLLSEMGLSIPPAQSDKEARVVGPVRGGGPTITVRSTRGDLTLQTRDVEKARDEKPKEEKAR